VLLLLLTSLLHAASLAPTSPSFVRSSFAPTYSSIITSNGRTESALFGKKKKGTPGPSYSNNKRGGGGGGGQPQQEKASVKEARFDAATRQFMFTLVGLTKTLPDKSKDILKNIHLSFYPGAKIGVVGLNGSGKSTLLKIMAGIEKEYDGIARPLPGASIGYLSQEPILEYETVRECIDAAVSSSRAILDRYNELGASMANPDISDEEMTSAMNEMERISDKIEAENLWELDRTVERAMDSLRVPPGDAKTAVLSGGEKRRVSLCQLLLESHDMLLLDEVRSACGALHVRLCIRVAMFRLSHFF
jgi:sulfate-transporting ATPase